MLKKVVVLSGVLALVGPVGAHAQSNGGKLAFLIPNLYGPSGLTVDSQSVLPSGETHSAHYNSAFQTSFTQLNTLLAIQLATPPLPSPASGFTYTLDPALGVFQRTTDSFGPLLAERAETIGKGKVSFGFSYQRFTFDTVEGIDLEELPAVFTHDNPTPGGRSDLVTTVNAIQADTDRFTAFLTWGVADRLDVSVAVPLLDSNMTVTSDATIRRIGTQSNPAVHYYGDANGGFGSTRPFVSSGQATGIGDVALRLKAAVLHGKAGLALGADVRFPTGDEENLLGSGAWGARPFLAFSLATRIGGLAFSPHLNAGYLWNGESVLAGDIVAGTKGDMPNQASWVFGFDLAATKGITLSADVLGRTVFNSQRVVETTFHALDGVSTFPDIGFESGDFTAWDAAVGIKANPSGRLLLDLGLVFALNKTGVRDTVTPLVGFEYSF